MGAAVALIEPHYPKAGNGRQPMPLERMLRIYFMQHWFNLSDPQAEDALYDIESMRRFAGHRAGGGRHSGRDDDPALSPSAGGHQLTEAIFAEVATLLEERRLLLKRGTIVDATIIAAPPSTKNAEQERDPEMHQTRKGKQWYFGMKAHMGTDRRGMVHSLRPPGRRTADITQMHQLLHGQEQEVFGDQAYWSETHRQSAKRARHPLPHQRRGTSAKPLTDHQKLINQAALAGAGSWRARLPCGQAPVGLHQGALSRPGQEHRAPFTAFALANLYLLRRRLLPPRRSVSCERQKGKSARPPAHSGCERRTFVRSHDSLWFLWLNQLLHTDLCRPFPRQPVESGVSRLSKKPKMGY